MFTNDGQWGYYPKPIGTGNTATVFLGRKFPEDQVVAYKVGREEMSLDSYDERGENLCALLQKEATLLASINHPNIVHAIDFDIGMSGPKQIPIIVLEAFIPSASINRKILSVVNLNQQIEIFEQMASSVDFLHNFGWVVGDICSNNFLINSDTFQVKLSDFTFAKRITDQSRANYLLPGYQLGMVSGTQGYAPLKISMEGRWDVVSERFAFLATIFELLNGQPPFGRASRVQGHFCDMEDPTKLVKFVGSPNINFSKTAKIELDLFFENVFLKKQYIDRLDCAKLIKVIKNILES